MRKAPSGGELAPQASEGLKTFFRKEGCLFLCMSGEKDRGIAWNPTGQGRHLTRHNRKNREGLGPSLQTVEKPQHCVKQGWGFGSEMERKTRLQNGKYWYVYPSIFFLRTFSDSWQRT